MLAATEQTLGEITSQAERQLAKQLADEVAAANAADTQAAQAPTAAAMQGVLCAGLLPPSAVQPYRTRCPCSGDTGRAAEGHADGRWTDDDDGRCDTCGRRPQALPSSGTRCTATSACHDTRAPTVANATFHSRPRSEAALSGVPCRRTGSCAGHSPASPACASGCASSDTCAGHCQPSEPNSNSAHPWSRAHGHRDGCQG